MRNNLSCYLSLISYLLILINCNKIKKNILVVIFPGGQHKNILMKSLFDYSIKNNTDSEYEYYYDIVLHLSEKNIWEKKIKSSENLKYKLLAFGDLSNEIEKYDIDDLPKQNLFKFYQIKLRLYNQDFLDSDVIEKLKTSKIKYNLLITDRPNYISFLLSQELNIEKKMYLSMRPLPQLFYKERMFINPSFIPTLGSLFTNFLDFKQRCSNYFNHLTDRILNFLSNYEIKYLYNTYDYTYITTNEYFNENTIILIQYPIGFTYPMYFPPNIIPLNSIFLVNKYLPIKNKFTDKIDEFLVIYKSNVVLSKEILHQMKYVTLNNLINKMSDLGFIYLYDESEKEEEFEKNHKKLNNLFVLEYKKYEFNDYEHALNYLLKKNNINGLITNSNINEIFMSVYYVKPIISFGNGIYQQNINAYINKNTIGVVINNKNINNYLTYIEALKKIIQFDDDEIIGENNIYIKQCKKFSNILKKNENPRNEYLRWLNYGMENDYEDLKIAFYKESNWFVINSYDVIITAIIIIGIFNFIMYLGIKHCCLFCYELCCNSNKKNDNKENLTKKEMKPKAE